MKPYQEYKNESVRLVPSLCMESYELSYDKSNFNENGDLTSYWFDERQKERIANLINSKISEYFQNNFDKLLAEAKERVGQGNIVR